MSTTGASDLALKHESEISSLKAGMQGIANEVADTRMWLQKMEEGIEGLSSSITAQLSRVTDRITTRNPMVYIGIGSLVLTMIATASALTIFTINAQIKPMENQVESMTLDRQKAEDRWQANYEQIIRYSERLRYIERELDGRDRDRNRINAL